MRKRLLSLFAVLGLLLVNQSIFGQICRKELLPAKYQYALLAWYPFCNNTLDASGNNNHGIAAGNTTASFDRYRRPNTAWSFSGDNCESRIDAQIKGLDTLNKLSISFWVKREGNGCENPRLFEFWPGSDAAGHCVAYMRNGENKIGFQHRTSTNYLISREFAFPKDDWMFFAYTNDGEMARFYIDCILVDSMPSQGKPILSKNVSFGRMNHPQFDAFNGKLDEIMIHGLCFDVGGLGGLYGLCDDPEKPFNVFPDTSRFCNGSPLLDAGPDAEAYVWSTNETTRTIRPKASGWYNVMVSKGYGCDLRDSTYALLLKADIKQKDTTVCIGTTLKLNIDSLFPVLPGNTLPKITARWSTGQTGNSITITPQQSTTIVVNVTDGVMSCLDTIRIGVVDPGNFNPLPDSLEACAGSKLTLRAGKGLTDYRWSTGASLDSIVVDLEGKYSIQIGPSQACSVRDSTYIRFIKADILQNDTSVCKGEPIRLSIDPQFGSNISYANSYQVRWSTGASGNTIQLNPQSTETYKVTVTSGMASCIDSVKVSLVDPTLFNPLNDAVNICKGSSATLNAGPGFTSYSWSNGAKTQTITVKLPGKYKVTASIANGCPVSDSTVLGYLPPDSCKVPFTDITRTSALDNFKHVMQVLDVDNDFDDDLLVHNSWPSATTALPSLTGYRLLKNNGAGNFSEFPSNGGLNFSHLLQAAINADLDNNGFQDIVLTGMDSLSIFRNTAGAFSDLTVKAGFEKRTISARLSIGKGDVQSKLFADVNQDGMLDLVVIGNDGAGSRVYGLISRLDCETGFVRFDSTAVLVTSGVRLGGINFADLDNDFDMDMLLLEYPSGDQYSQHTYRTYFNNGRGVFTLNAGTGISSGRSAYFGISGDLNNDGRADVISTPADCCVGDNPIGVWFSAPAFPYFVNQTAVPRAGNPYYGGTTPFDFDLDGREDILWRNLASTGDTQGAKVQLHLNNGDNTFTESAALFNINYGPAGNCCPITAASQSSLLDYNSDGKVDIFIESNSWDANTAAQQGRWLLRNTLTKNHLNIRLQACTGVRDGTGARIRYKFDGQWYNKLVNYSGSQYEPLADYITLGLGTAASADSIEVLWVGGARSYLVNQPANRNLIINESANCPRLIPKPLTASITVAASKPSVCVGEEIVFTATPTNGGDNPVFSWRVNGGNTGVTGNTFKSKGLKNNDVVTCILTSSSNCVTNTTANSNAIPVKVEICVDDVYVPNTFTPNGDGKNDVLKVYGTYQQSTLSVYNQWGQLLFTGDGMIGWDGRHKGVMQPSGTYVYVAEVVVSGEKTITKKGNVNLIR